MGNRWGNGEGGLRLRPDGRWEATLEVPSGGRRQRRYFYGKTKKQAAAKRTEFLRAQQATGATPDLRRTVANLLDAFLVAKEPELKASTFMRYEGLIRNNLVPDLGRFRLTSLTASDIKASYRKLIAAGLSPQTVRHAHTVLKAALKFGVQRRWVERNEADFAKPQRLPERAIEYLSTSEMRALVAAAVADPLGSLYIVAAHTGMREGELLGLRWTDVDLARPALTVSHTLTRDREHRLVLTEPRTAGSRRTLPLTPDAADALDRQAAALEKHRVTDPGWNPEGFVFTTSAGTPINPSNLLRRHFYPFLERAGLPKVRFHALRHSYPTGLLEDSASVGAVSRLLGHASPTTTLRIYAHTTDDMLAATVALRSEQLAVSLAVNDADEEFEIAS